MKFHAAPIAVLVVVVLALPLRAQTAAPAAAPDVVPVTFENFNRAESDLYFTSSVKEGGFGKFHHIRELAPVDHQTVVRMNRDTLYSAAVFDLDAGPATITLPNSHGRFMSMQIIDEEQNSPMVVYDPHAYTLTRERVGTRYVMAGIRILLDPVKPGDLEEVHKLQDAIQVEQKSEGKFDVPHWDPVSQAKVRDALAVLGSTVSEYPYGFGPRDEVDPIQHLICSAIGWGGNPEQHAKYLTVTPTHNDGKTPYQITVKKVPVEAFWSITVYNEKGYFEPNPQNAYSINNLTAAKNADGSITVHFGACDGKTTNCLPITPGWNYTVRLYRPRRDILDGSWKFPHAEPVKQ